MSVGLVSASRFVLNQLRTLAIGIVSGCATLAHVAVTHQSDCWLRWLSLNIELMWHFTRYNKAEQNCGGLEVAQVGIYNIKGDDILSLDPVLSKDTGDHMRQALYDKVNQGYERIIVPKYGRVAECR
jgi:hypothetical protein